MKARIATKATTAASTAPVWLRMRMRSGSAAATASESVLVLGSDEQPQRLGCFHCTGAMPRRRACVKWCKIGQRAALLRLERLLVSYRPLAWLGRRAADFEDSLTLLRLGGFTRTVYTVEVASAIRASA